MSWQASLLNRWLRWTEKPFLTKAQSVTVLRRSFEIKARLFFHGPLGLRRRWRDLAGAPALCITPRRAGPTLLFFHGGAHVFGSPRTQSAMLAALAKRADATAVLPQYPLAPEHPFPAALDHCVATYRALLAEGVDPATVIVGGDSAGGNLAFAVLADLLAAGDPLPAGVFGLSPLMDLAFTGDSFLGNAAADVVLPASRIWDTALGYLKGHPADDPRASPLHADFTGAPPVWLSVGDTEILQDDTLRLADRLRAAGVSVALQLERDLPHVWPMFHNIVPEARTTLDQLAAWIKVQTGANAPTR
ncbi:MAG: alpha/beta hydrolase [Pseudomonadota bacterium]